MYLTGQSEKILVLAGNLKVGNPMSFFFFQT